MQVEGEGGVNVRQFYEETHGNMMGFEPMSFRVLAFHSTTRPPRKVKKVLTYI